MDGPGSYVADPTEGITGVEDLPPPQIVKRSRNYRRGPCPRCGRRAYRLRTAHRILHDLGDPMSGRPRKLDVTYSQHRCPACGCYFNADLSDLAAPSSLYTHRVVVLAVRLVVEDGLPDPPWPRLTPATAPEGRGCWALSASFTCSRSCTAR